MSNQKNTTLIITTQQRSNAGKAAAANMTAAQRRERALKASHSRACMKDLPKATHTGDLLIGGTAISCCVLEDGRRLITETSMFQILGRRRTGRKGGSDLPTFLSANNLKPLINNALTGGGGVVSFLTSTSGKSYGYDATLIPEICKLFLDARKLGILTPNQLPTAERSEVILHALAKTGIISLIDEATGHQLTRENNELQKLFNRFLAKELQPWTKCFPNEFFENIKRIYSLEHLKKTPSFAGHLINRYVYGEISKEVLDELKQRNPITGKGKRKHRHHQLLSSDVGHPALEKQILKINTLMSVSRSKEEFDELVERQKYFKTI